MNLAFWIVLLLFVIVSVSMILIILVQRPQGGGLSGAFGGASVGGSDTVFGGRTGDALTYATVAAFIVYLTIAISLNLIDPAPERAAADEQEQIEEQQQQPDPAPQPGPLPGQQPGMPEGGEAPDIDPDDIFNGGGMGAPDPDAD